LDAKLGYDMESSASLICATWNPLIWRILKLGLQAVIATCHCVNGEILKFAQQLLLPHVTM